MVQRGATAARHLALQDRLVAAAEETIAGEGLGALKARAVAEAAGCSVGAIYGVFPDLDALILVVNGRTLEAIEAALAGVGRGGEPGAELVGLGEAYLAYAAGHRRRWEALFQHRMAEGRAIPAWYAARQAAVFAFVEAPLGVLRPGLGAEERALLARTLFSAVHGMVALGLDEKVAGMGVSALRGQVGVVVAAMARGLAA